MRTIVDTNTLVSTVTNRDAEQRRRAESLFRSSAAGETAILIPQCVLFELLFVLRNLYRQDEETIRALLAGLISMPGVLIVSELDVDEWLKLWPAVFDDVVDAAIAVVARDTKSRVATFDRKFARRLNRSEIATW